jgi:hypothetical protein
LSQVGECQKHLASQRKLSSIYAVAEAKAVKKPSAASPLSTKSGEKSCPSLTSGNNFNIKVPASVKSSFIKTNLHDHHSSN